MQFTLSFVGQFSKLVIITSPILVFLIMLIVLLALVCARTEKWKYSESLYWAFITATTVGYGDIRPKARLSRILAVIIGITGLMLFGIIITIAVHATSAAIKLHVDSAVLPVLSAL